MMEGTSCLRALRSLFCLRLLVLYSSDETLLIRQNGRNDRHASFGACQRCGGKLFLGLLMYKSSPSYWVR